MCPSLNDVTRDNSTTVSRMPIEMYYDNFYDLVTTILYFITISTFNPVARGLTDKLIFIIMATSLHDLFTSRIKSYCFTAYKQRPFLKIYPRLDFRHKQP